MPVTPEQDEKLKRLLEAGHITQSTYEKTINSPVQWGGIQDVPPPEAPDLAPPPVEGSTTEWQPHINPITPKDVDEPMSDVDKNDAELLDELRNSIKELNEFRKR